MLSAIGVGAVVASMPFGTRIGQYGLGGLSAAVVAVTIVRDGNVSRPEGTLLIAG